MHDLCDVTVKRKQTKNLVREVLLPIYSWLDLIVKPITTDTCMAATVDNRSLHWPSKACSLTLMLASSSAKEFTSPTYQLQMISDRWQIKTFKKSSIVGQQRLDALPWTCIGCSHKEDALQSDLKHLHINGSMFMAINRETLINENLEIPRRSLFLNTSLYDTQKGSTG